MTAYITCKPFDKHYKLIALKSDEVDAWKTAQPNDVQTWLEQVSFNGQSGETVWLPMNNEAILLFGLGASIDTYSFSSLPSTLQAKFQERSQSVSFEIERSMNPEEATLTCLGWGLGAYSFDQYKKEKKTFPSLLCPPNADYDDATNQVEAVHLIRDLINIPANDMTTSGLHREAESLADEFDADFNAIIGDHLLEQNYPGIHAVGRASEHAPRLLDIRWGNESHPKVTLVGKGVCFDTGGLDLKPRASMYTMKKDMGGGAHVLGLAKMIMKAKLPVRLRVLVPAVENAVAGNAFRPSDILTMRNGTTVEIGDTDAEGRLVLADALTEASTESPDILIDMATLTGGFTVGHDIPAYFCNEESAARNLPILSQSIHDPVWNMPLPDDYISDMKSDVAELKSTVDGRGGPAVYTALFLQEFIDKDIDWMHFDLYGWSNAPRPGRPKGGHAQAVRALYVYLKEKYSS